LHTALMMADMAYATLVEFGQAAYRSVSEHRLTPDVERVIEGTVLLSGIGFESGGLSLAHALIRGLTAVPAMASRLHGELVAFGTLVQVLVENRPQPEIDELVHLLCAVNLPVSFSQLGQGGNPSSADINTIVEATMKAAYARNMSPPLTANRLAECIAEADCIGRKARIGKGEPMPARSSP
jgi:glycerol dehydrogenase